ncbi:MAG: TIGR02099 family protein [Gammaproteobacteria bacterium]|nr:TIGR02099 family protein [Gammaproteobacteria bacterium]
MSFRILRLVYHFSVYLIGVLVLSAAVVVTLIRLVLPDIGIYRGEVEAWVSHYMGYPVVIHSLNADWYGWIPHLHLTNVDLLNKAGTQAITHFESAEIRIDPVATLLARRFVPRQLTVSGFDLTVARRENGGIVIEGIDIGEVEETAGSENELAEWLFSQDTIEIRNGRVEWIDAMHEQAPILLTDVALTLRTDDDRIQLEGTTMLPTVYGNRMDFAFDASGDLLTSQWSGELYLFASNINPDHWYRKYRPLNINIAGGSADIRVWSRWDSARLSSVNGELQYQDFAASVGDANLRVERLGYRFSGERTAEGGWELQMNVKDLMTEHGLWPDANVIVHARPVHESSSMRYSIGFDYLKLDDLVPMVSRLEFLPDKLRRATSAIGIKGELRNGRLEIDPSAEDRAQILYDVRFDRLAAEIGKRLPRLKNASGRTHGSLRAGRIEFDGDGAELEAPAVRLKRLAMDGLTGELRWSRESGGWSFQSDGLRLNTPDFPARLAGSVNVPAEPEASIETDLFVEIGAANVEKLSRYLPELANFKLKNWMERAVVGGRLTSAHAVLRGRLAHFPYDQDDGRFQLIANVEDVVLDYSDKWPPVDALSAEIGIDGNAMRADLHGGNVFRAGIDHGSVRIDDILSREKVIDISGTVSGTTTDLKLFIDQSPLAANAVLGRVRESLGEGAFELDLNLGVPVPAPGRNAEVDGTLRLAGATLNSRLGKFALSDLTGEVGFSRTSAAGEGLSAMFYGRPVTVSVAGSQAEPLQVPELTVRGSVDESFIVDRLTEFFPPLTASRESLLERVHGNADWELTLAFDGSANSPDAGSRIEIVSDLRGMQIDLPAPVGKNIHEAVPIAITRDIGGASASSLGIQYGSILQSTIALDGTAVRAIALHFGDGDPPPGTAGGIRLTGYLERLPVADWWQVLREHVAADPDRMEPAGPVSALVQIGDLELFGRSFPEVHIAGEREAEVWLFHLDGADIAGDVELPFALEGDAAVTLGLERLHLSQSGQEAPGKRISPRNVPVLHVDIGDLVYDGKELGRVALNTHPIADGLAIEQFRFQKPDLLISGTGNWTQTGGEDKSEFNISLNAAQFDAMLKTFGYNVTAIDKGETDLSIDAAWAGTPMDFSLANLNGSLNMQIRKGQLLDIEPKAGRLFGLLSIQTLPRRLSLDFTDLFGKGLAFDVIEGNFQISSGDAYTNDLYLRGPSANVAVTGRTGLAEKDYDQLVTVTPQIADTLPVASALFGPIGIGIGAVLYLAGEVFESIHNKIDTLLKYQYTITGSWDEPVIEKYQGSDEVRG